MGFKKIRFLLVIIVLVSMMPLSVSVMASTNSISNVLEVDNGSSSGECALVPVESEKLGSITICLEDTNKQLSKENVKLAVTKVADVVGGVFELKENYNAVDVNLNEIQNANELELEAKKLEKIVTSPDMCVITNTEGIAKISELPVGVYLIYVEDMADYENITPFLISIPTFQEMKGTMEYDVEVYPKHTPLEEKEKPEVPQTGIENHTAEYVALSLCCLIMTGILVIIFLDRGNKGKNNV